METFFRFSDQAHEDVYFLSLKEFLNKTLPFPTSNLNTWADLIDCISGILRGKNDWTGAKETNKLVFAMIVLLDQTCNTNSLLFNLAVYLKREIEQAGVKDYDGYREVYDAISEFVELSI